ncbi:MAG TPA: molybdopterin molybdotransferase MoeA [Jatrophihabitans sp.]|jgi:molybdopterin molybdotransferase
MTAEAGTSLSWHAAREVARGAVKPLPTIELPLPLAVGFALAEPLRALIAMPGYDNAAMDGYAVAGGGPWTVVGTVAAGEEPLETPLRPGEAAGIATGAPTPQGTEAVLPVEQSVRMGSEVHGEVSRGKHVRRMGEDFGQGAELLPVGTVVSAAVAGLAASVGYDRLVVHRKPTVAIVITGDEVMSAGLPPPGHVRDAIGPTVPGLVSAAGGLVDTVLVKRDGAAVLAEILTKPEADVVVICGGTSVGPADHLRSVLRELRAELLVDTVACRPGHPQLLAALPGGRPVVGLPGNPFAAVAAVVTLLNPILGSLGGRRLTARATARWGGGVDPHLTRTRLIPVRVESGLAVPVGHDRPGTLAGVALADALAVLPPRWSGEDVELVRLS